MSESVGKEEESSGVPCPAKKKKIDDVGNVVLAAHVASPSSPPDKADATGKHKSQHLETRNDYAILPKKIGLKVIDESLREMLFSVRTTTKLGKLMQNYSKRLGLDVSCFKFIFDGRRILEDETVKQLEMEYSDTINVMFNGSSMGLMTEPERKSREAKAKIQFEIHKDRQILLDPKENTSKKLSNSKSKPGDGRSQKEGHCFFLKAN